MNQKEEDEVVGAEGGALTQKGRLGHGVGKRKTR